MFRARARLPSSTVQREIVTNVLARHETDPRARNKRCITLLLLATELIPWLFQVSVVSTKWRGAKLGVTLWKHVGLRKQRTSGGKDVFKHDAFDSDMVSSFVRNVWLVIEWLKLEVSSFFRFRGILICMKCFLQIYIF